MAKVYVSSTVADLEGERRAVMEWLVAAGHQPVHSYRPSSDTVRDSCLDDIDACDLYVLILGYRYGFQPEDGNPDGLSITHLEFRRAGQAGIPRIALLRAGTADVGLSDGEGPQKAALLAGFWAEVTGAVRAAEFGDLRGLVQGLSTGVQAELDKLFPAGRVLRMAPRPPFLAGREGLLAELEDRLAAGDRRGPRVAVLHGLGGAGKTSVALEYAHRHQARADVVWQLPAEDPTVLAAGFADLAAALGAGEGSGDPVVAVHGVLGAYRGGWLLVFDNAPDPAAVERFLPPVGQGRVLITSRNALWPPAQLVEVPVLDTGVAAGFLVDRTGDSDEQAAAGLAEAVGGLPLALEQAGAYIQATGDSLAGYLAGYQQRRADLLARGEPTGYPGTVATTWALAFTRLQDSDPGAAGLLRLLAFCAPEPVPLGLLLRPRPGLIKELRRNVLAKVMLRPSPEDRLMARDAVMLRRSCRKVAKILEPLLEGELAARDAVAALRRYSLVRPAGDGAVSVHRLVQAVTADQMPEGLREGWRAAVAALIEAAIPADTALPESWPACALLLPHAQAALTDESNGMSRLASYLGYRGGYAAALELEQRVLQARERLLGTEHPNTLVTRGNLARWTGAVGDAAGARDQYAALLPAVERVLGAEHLEVKAVRSSLANWTGAVGDAAGARDQYAALLPAVERVLGAEHPDTLFTRGNLAEWTGAVGDAAGARDQYAALLPAVERVLGAEHPDTLAARASLASWTGAVGDAAGARDQYAALLPAVERVLGAEHPDTLAARGHLASWTGAVGDAAGARDQYAALLPAVERVLGAEHPDTLAARGSLASLTGAVGDAAGARDQFAALLPAVERVLGAEHPDTLAARGSLASLTGAVGDAAGARDQFAALLPAVERVLGAEHPDTLTVRADLARWTGEAGDAAGARDQFAALLATYERVLGAEHPDIKAARASLASLTEQGESYCKARDSAN